MNFDKYFYYLVCSNNQGQTKMKWNQKEPEVDQGIMLKIGKYIFFTINYL